MRAALVIGGKDLRQQVRNRSAFVVAFLAPIALASIISITVGNLDDFDFEATLVLVDNDRSALSQRFATQVLGGDELRDRIEVTTAPNEAAARQSLEQEAVGAGFVVPTGFEERIVTGQDAEITVLRSPHAPIAGPLAEGIASAFLDRVDASRLSVMTAIRAGGSDVAALGAAAAEEQMPIRLTPRPLGGDEVSGANYFGPAMAMFFLFFTVGWGAGSVLVERRQGTLARMRAAPISRAAIVGGKALAVFVIGLASMATMFVFMAAVFGARWGDPLAVAVLTVAIVLAAMTLTAAVATFARTDEQAGAYTSMVVISLALLGGNFFPLHQMPDVVQKLALATPNGWALRGYTDLVYDGGGLGAVGANVAFILTFAVAMAVVASVGARRALR